MNKMSLDKAIKHGKEKREPYRKSKRWDHSCRNHGSCSYCEGNRTIQSEKALEGIIEQEDDFCKCECADDMVSGDITGGEIVTVEEWNSIIDKRDELRNK